MSEEKTYPLHRINFQEKRIDQNGEEKLGYPVEVGVTWQRKNDKEVENIQWHLAPEKHGEGVYSLRKIEREQQRNGKEKDEFDQADASPQSDTGLAR